MKTEIYIATHKNFSFPVISGYVPIEVGRSLRDAKIHGIIGDDTKENISSLNKNFCELTAMFWIWKNSNADYKGLVHYRRYFSNRGGYTFFDNIPIVREREICDIFIKYDVILPKKVLIRKKKIFIHSLKKNYEKDHSFVDWKNLGDIIKEIKPEYYQSYLDVGNKKTMYCYNMIIAKKKVFDDYCSWLFEIIFELYKITSFENYDSYQARVFGFISERMLNIYFHKNSNVKVKEITVKQLK